MIKVLIVIPNVGTGGAERLVLDLSRLMDKKKFDVTLLCYYNTKPEVYGELIESENINIIFLDKKLGLDLSMFFKVKKIVKQLKPDVIHAHLDSLLYLIPSFNKKQRKLFTVHNIARYEAIGILQKNIRSFCFRVLNVSPVAISPCFVIDIANHYQLDINQIYCIPNGIDFDKFNINRTQEYKKNVFKFISVGAMKPQKNQKLLIRAFANVHERNKNTQLTILGDGVLRLEIENLIKDYNLENCVTLMGVVSNVEDYFAGSDAFVLSSDFEGLPLSILEAMACGLPVISTKTGGTIDIIENDVNGYLVESRNEAQLGDAMYRMSLLSEEDRSEFIEKSLELLIKYDINRCVKDHERIYANSQ